MKKPKTPAGPKGYSLFFRKDRKKWLLVLPTRDGGWKEPVRKFLPAEIGEKDTVAAETWTRTFIETVEGEHLELTPRPRARGVSLRERVESWKLIRAEDRKTSPATRKGYADLFKNVVLKPFADGKKMRSLGDEDLVSVGVDYSLIRKWLRAITALHSPSRVRAAFFAFRSFFDDAKLEKWWRGENPLANAGLLRELPELPTAAEKGGVVHMLIDIAQQLIVSPKVPLRRRVRYVTALTTGGVRDGEVSGLTWNDLGLGDGGALPRMEVKQARRLVREKDEERGRLKTRTSRRAVAIHTACCAAFIEWRDDELDGIAIYLGRKPIGTDPVFPSARPRDRGKFARPASSKLLREDLLAAGLPTTTPDGRPITFHALRASFGNWLYEYDVEEITRRRLMGHGAQNVTEEFYTGKAFAKMTEEIQKLPLRWTTGVGYEPAPRRPRSATGPRPGTLTSRILDYVKAHPGVSGPEVARVLGANPNTTTMVISKLRASGHLERPASQREPVLRHHVRDYAAAHPTADASAIADALGLTPNAAAQHLRKLRSSGATRSPQTPTVPTSVPATVPAGTVLARNMSDVGEPLSRLELETYGLRNREPSVASAVPSAGDDGKRTPKPSQVDDLKQVDDLAEQPAEGSGTVDAVPGPLRAVAKAFAGARRVWDDLDAVAESVRKAEGES